MGLDGKFLSVEIVGTEKRTYTERLQKRERELEEDVTADWAREQGALQSFTNVVVWNDAHPGTSTRIVMRLVRVLYYDEFGELFLALTVKDCLPSPFF